MVDEIPVHPLLRKLVDSQEKPSNAIALRGYVGPSRAEGLVTLYPRLGNLFESYEIARDDIVAFEEAPGLPNGGMIIWVKKDAEVTHRRGETTRTQAQNLVNIRRGRLFIRINQQVDLAHPNYCRCGGCGGCGCF
jgi:hypothetical protein